MSEKRSKFNELYSSIRSDILKKVEPIVRKNDEDLEECVVAIAATVGCMVDEFADYYQEVREEYNLDELEIDDEADKEIAKEATNVVKQYEDYDIFEFIALIGVYAFKFSEFDCSKLEKEFGYNACLDGIVAYFNSKNKNCDISDTFAELQGIERSIPFNQYMQEELYLNDIQHIQDLFNRTKEEKVTREDFSDLGLTVRRLSRTALGDENIDTIKERLTYIMESSFALKEYLGIWTDDKEHPVISLNRNKCIPGKDYYNSKLDGEDGHIYNIEPISFFNKSIREALNEHLSLTFVASGDTRNISQSRTFDLVDIYNNFNKAYIEGDEINIRPIYFPYKMLEIIEKYKYTKFNANNRYPVQHYKRSDVLDVKDCGNLETFVNYELKNIEEELNYFVGLVTVDYVKNEATRPIWATENLKDFENDGTLIKDLYILFHNNKFDTNTVEFGKFTTRVDSAIKYCIDCMTNCILLYKEQIQKIPEKYDCYKYTVNDFYFKICISNAKLPIDGLNGISESKNEAIIHKILGSGEGIGTISGFKSTIDNSGRFLFYDLKHTCNKKLIDSTPLFAYHALEALNSRKVDKFDKDGNLIPTFPVSWDNILLGKNSEDELVFSKENGKIFLGKNRAHWIVAGSRSGKGVMCYNIFATAAASKVPIFYVDRKPDTSDAMTERAPNMFAVNGGDASNMAPNSVLGRDKNLLVRGVNVPEYLYDSLKLDDLYDIVYTRAFMLLWQMATYVDEFGDSAFINYLRGLNVTDNGFIFVIDEFTNYLGDSKFFKETFSNVNTKVFGKELVEKDDSISKAESNLSKKQNDKKATEADINKAEKDLDRAEQIDVPILQLYYTALYYGFRSIKRALDRKVNASGGFIKNVQSFLIGQDIDEVKASLENPTIERESKLISSTSRYSPLVEIYKDITQTDFIVGYHPSKNLVGQDNNRLGEMLNGDTRGFAYKEGMLSLSMLRSIDDGDKSDKISADGWSTFKPFLILNNSVMPDLSVLPKKLGDTAKKWASSKTDGAQTLGDAKYIAQCIGFSMGAGITLEELLDANADENDPNKFDKRVGFSDYVEAMATTSDGVSNADEIWGTLNLSGAIADEFVKDVYGYTDGWRKFVHDLRPEWIVTYDGITETNGKSPTIVQNRLKSTFFKKEIVMLDPVKLIGRDVLGSIADYYFSSGNNGNKKDYDLFSNVSAPNEQEEDDYVEPEEQTDSDTDYVEPEDTDYVEPEDTDYVEPEDTDYVEPEEQEEEVSVNNDAFANSNEDSINNNFNGISGISFEEPVNASVKQQEQPKHIDFSSITDMAYETLLQQVIDEVNTYVLNNFGSNVANNEKMQQMIYDYSKTQTLAYLQEKGVM